MILVSELVSNYELKTNEPMIEFSVMQSTILTLITGMHLGSFSSTTLNDYFV